MATLMDMGEAIAQQPAPPRQVFCGFDLWIEVLSSGKTKMGNFLTGGVPAKGDEADNVLEVPLTVVGRNIVVGLDITLPPDGFRIAP